MNKGKLLGGVGVMIFKDNVVLIGRRKGGHGNGEYAFPGGKMEIGESFVECAKREIMEECGIEIKNIRFQCLSNILQYPPNQYLHVGLVADWAGGEPMVLEPNKVTKWQWRHLSKLPKPLFMPTHHQVIAYQSFEKYFDLPAK